MGTKGVRAAVAVLVLCVAIGCGQGLAQTPPPAPPAGPVTPPTMTINSLRGVESSGMLGAAATRCKPG